MGVHHEGRGEMDAWRENQLFLPPANESAQTQTNTNSQPATGRVSDANQRKGTNQSQAPLYTTWSSQATKTRKAPRMMAKTGP